MFVCPVCHASLETRHKQTGVFYHCAACGGRAVGLGALRRSVAKPAIDALWRAADAAPAQPSRRCPACSLPMRGARAPAESGSVELDVCRRCHLVWFDAGERERLEPLPERDPNYGMSATARAAVAIFQSERLREEADRAPLIGGDAPDEWWKWIPALFGWPVERESTALTRLPLVSWGSALLLALIAIGLWGDYEAVAARHGFIAREAFRAGGATLLVYLLLPGGLLHGLSNAYFLAVFGDDIEEELGSRALATVLLLSGLAAAATHALIHPAAAAPLVGAQGALAGVMMFYSLRFPHARLAYLLTGRSWYTREGGLWLAIPAWAALLLWVALNLVGLHAEWTGWENLSTASLLGGAIAGYLCWLAWQDA